MRILNHIDFFVIVRLFVVASSARFVFENVLLNNENLISRRATLTDAYSSD